MMRGTQVIFVVATMLHCCCYMVTAAPLKAKSMTEPESSKSEIHKISERHLNTAAKLLQQHTQEWMTQTQDKSGRLLASTTTSECPVCEERFMKENKDEDEEESDSRIGNAIGKVKDMLNTDGSVLNTVKDGIVNATKTALETNGEESSASVETLIPVLRTSATQFTSIGQAIQTTKQQYIITTSNGDEVSADTADLVISIYDLLEDIVLAIADVKFAIIDAISDAVTAIVNLITNIILAILDLIEGIKLAIIQIIVDFLDAITGNDGGRKMMDLFDTSENGPIMTLKSILSSGRLGGIYSDVITSLQEQNDDSGLITVLMDSATDMEVIDEKLSVFLDSANQVIAAQSTDETSTEVTTISEDTVVQILDLIVDIISTILNLIVSIIVTVLNLIIGVITAIIDLIVGIIVSILELIISIINAILGIFSRQTGTASARTVTLLGIATTILASPIYDVMLCQLGLSSCTLPSEGIDCEVEALACQNEQLAKALAE